MRNTRRRLRRFSSDSDYEFDEECTGFLPTSGNKKYRSVEKDREEPKRCMDFLSNNKGWVFVSFISMIQPIIMFIVILASNISQKFSNEPVIVDILLSFTCLIQESIIVPVIEAINNIPLVDLPIDKCNEDDSFINPLFIPVRALIEIMHSIKVSDDHILVFIGIMALFVLWSLSSAIKYLFYQILKKTVDSENLGKKNKKEKKCDLKTHHIFSFIIFLINFVIELVCLILCCVHIDSDIEYLSGIFTIWIFLPLVLTILLYIGYVIINLIYVTN